jgi:hypothetical protein
MRVTFDAKVRPERSHGLSEHGFTEFLLEQILAPDSSLECTGHTSRIDEASQEKGGGVEKPYYPMTPASAGS